MSSKYNRKDALYDRAKEEGYRSRAAYKLIELQERFKICRSGACVLDLGAWPGGWLQVASEIVGERGKVVGIDIAVVEPLPCDNVQVLVGDFSNSENVEAIRAASPKGFDAVLSDASPKLSGINEADQASTAQCAHNAFAVAKIMLRNGGNFVCKIFKGQETDQFVKSLKKSFKQVSRIELEASRNSSSETYVVAKGFST